MKEYKAQTEKEQVVLSSKSSMRPTVSFSPEKGTKQARAPWRRISDSNQVFGRQHKGRRGDFCSQKGLSLLTAAELTL